MKKIILVICLLLLTGCSIYDEYKMPDSVTLETKTKTYKVYSKHKIKDLINLNRNMHIMNYEEKQCIGFECFYFGFRIWFCSEQKFKW